MIARRLRVVSATSGSARRDTRAQLQLTAIRMLFGCHGRGGGHIAIAATPTVAPQQIQACRRTGAAISVGDHCVGVAHLHILSESWHMCSMLPCSSCRPLTEAGSIVYNARLRMPSRTASVSRCAPHAEGAARCSRRALSLTSDAKSRSRRPPLPEVLRFHLRGFHALSPADRGAKRQALAAPRRSVPVLSGVRLVPTRRARRGAAPPAGPVRAPKRGAPCGSRVSMGRRAHRAHLRWRCRVGQWRGHVASR